MNLLYRFSDDLKVHNELKLDLSKAESGKGFVQKYKKTIECKSGKNLKQNTKVNFTQAWQLRFISWTKFRIRKLIGESMWGVSKENVEVKAQNLHRIIQQREKISLL